jgi:predicted nucleotidyltransferase
MHDQRLAVVEIGEEIFGAPTQIEEAAPRQARGEIGRKGKAQIRAPLLDARDPRAKERRGEATPDRLDFGQFGHESILCGRAFATARRRAIKETPANHERPMRLEEEAVVDHLRRRFPDAIAIYLFGSVASGEAGPESDVDLALLNDGKIDPVALWDVAGELANIVDRHVDLVDLRMASTVLQHQILTKGRRLFARDVRAGIYEAFILSEKTALDERNAGLLADILREGRVHGR